MYQIEVRLANKNGYHTPDEARRYYGKYSRSGVTIHWWNTPQAVKDSDHDNIVNYILNKAVNGSGSVNYVLSNNKITLLVNPDNVAWASQGGNPTTVSIECSPHLNAEGYKKLGWLINELFNPNTGRYKQNPGYWKHSDWFQTQCPGTISMDEIKNSVAKWFDGQWDDIVEWKRNLKELPLQTLFACDDQTPLRNLNNVGEVIKNFGKGTPFAIKGMTTVGGYQYYLTQYSFDNGQPNGMAFSELQATDPNAVPVPEPKPEPQMAFTLWKDGGVYVPNKTPIQLYDISTARGLGEIKPIKEFNPTDQIGIAGSVRNSFIDEDFYITRYSFDNKRATGFRATDLEVYVPPRPIPDPPEEPTEPTDPDPTPTPEPEVPGWFVKFLKDLAAFLLNWIPGVNIK